MFLKHTESLFQVSSRDSSLQKQYNDQDSVEQVILNRKLKFLLNFRSFAHTVGAWAIFRGQRARYTRSVKEQEVGFDYLIIVFLPP